MSPDHGAAMETARAEQGMLKALAVPRANVGDNPFIKSQAGLSAVIRQRTDCSVEDSNSDIAVPSSASAPGKVDGRQNVGDRLPALSSAKQRAHQEFLRQVDEVRALHHQPLETKLPRTGFEKLRRKQAERRERDARASKDFEAGVAAISEDMERRVLEASYRLRDGLEEVEEAVSTVRRELGTDHRLVEGNMTYVKDMWHKLEAQCNRRARCIEEFRVELESVEVLRSQAVGGELRRLVDDMVSTAYRMPGEMERITEEHASELNAVLISNRLAHADLLGKMEKEDFAFVVGIRRAWEIRREAWRRLRHDRALRYFHADLQASNFTNPAERATLFRCYKSGQSTRHEKRAKMLRDLCRRRPDAEEIRQKLTTEAVSSIQEEFAALHEEEIAAVLEAREELMRIRDAKLEDAQTRRESLRAELHEYGVLSPEPDWERCCLQVEAVVNGAEYEEFLRKAGGLKHELVNLVQGMRSSDIMYDSCLSEATERIKLLLCGVDLERVLDKQGKGGLWRGLIDSLECLRKASKNSIPPILDVVRRQAADLSQIPDIDPLLASCFEHATVDIDGVVNAIQRTGGRGGDGSGGDASSVGSRVSKTNDVASRASSSREQRRRRSANGSGEGTSSRSLGRQSRSSTSRGGWESDIEIDMPQVRAVQRRLGMLASASDLSEDFKDELRGIREALEQQRACNVAIDEVISAETTDELEARFSEHSRLLDRSIHFMDSRAVGLHVCAERFCSFFATIAEELEAHDRREMAIDEAGEQRMFDCAEDFRQADEDRERDVKDVTDRVRMAADEAELEASFDRAMYLLEEVEESYRAYHKNAFEASAKHPAEAAEEAERIRAAICAYVGLQPAPEEAVASAGCEAAAESINDDSGSGERDEDIDGELNGKTPENIDDDDADDNEEDERQEASPAASVEKEQNGIETYRAPSDSSGSGSVKYFVDRTPEEITQELLLDPSTNQAENEEDEINSLSDAEDDGNTSTGGADDGEGGKGGEGPKKQVARAGSRPAKVNSSDEPDDLPSYWRKRFVPLSREEVESLGKEGGQEAVTEYLDKRNRRFRELSEGELEHLRIACEAKAAARAKAKENAAKAANKKSGAKAKKKDDAKAKKGDRKGGAVAVAAGEPPPPTPGTVEQEVEPPSLLEEYEGVRRDVEEHRALRREEIALQHAKENLIPRDPTGEVVMEELSIPGEDAADMLRSLRDDLISSIERRAAARTLSAGAACSEAQEVLTAELEERLRRHWPRKGRTEVGSRQPREGELHAHRQKARRFIRQVSDKLSNQEKAFGGELQKVSSARKGFQQALARMTEGLAEAASIAALQGMESRGKRLVAAFEAEHQALLPRLEERFFEGEPARLLKSCDDFTRLCKTFAEGGDYDERELKELEELLQQPRQEISRAAQARREALAEAAEERKNALQDEEFFKKEHTRCIAELSLREGLGQRFGAPRRNAQERVRSVIMRDDRCAETIQRLLDDLERLLPAARGDLNVDDVQGGATFRSATTAPGTGRADDPRVTLKYPPGEEDGHEQFTETLPTTGENLTQLLRYSLLSLREALFRHATFLEFLPAPERVDRKRLVPRWDAEGLSAKACQDEMEEQIDSEVTLMPRDGETLAGSLESIEVRCRSETRQLYESEGKRELLGEGGVPESLRAWLQELRERVLGEGGHRQTSQRRLRRQVERFELLIAKRPVPRDPLTDPRAPALMLVDLSIRLEKEASFRRDKREENFERLITAWDTARSKHQRLLRPVLGSADRREELNELLAVEGKRAAEAIAAIVAFRQELVEEEAVATRERARRVAGCYIGVVAILDSVIMGDDLGKLPGDDHQETKRKGLRRLRKADRAFLRQETHDRSSPIREVGRKSSATKEPRARATVEGGSDDQGDGTIQDASTRGKGRQWARRKWRAAGLPDLARVILATVTVAGDSSVNFTAILDSTTVEDVIPEEGHPGATSAGIAGGKTAAVENSKKGSKKGKAKETVSAKKEADEAAEASKKKEEPRAGVRAWAEELQGALEEETFVTTAHRAVVAARDAFIAELTEKTKITVVKLQERYGRRMDAEIQWGAKWRQLVDLLISHETS